MIPEQPDPPAAVAPATNSPPTDSPTPAAIRAELDASYALPAGQLAFYREHGYVHLRQVFSPELLAWYGAEISRQVRRLNTEHRPLAERDTYGRAFLQVMNLWRQSPRVEEFVRGRRLARLAAELCGAAGVRLYHDQALYKEAGGGITPWHADQYYWPLDSDRTLTAWIPLQATPLEMGPLAFAPGSQRMTQGRDLEIGDESEARLERWLEDYAFEERAFALGDVSFHSGWTYHRAGENRSGRPREVMTIIYMDRDIRLTAPKNRHQQADHAAWLPGVQVGAVAASPLNPELFPAGENG